MPGRLLCIDLQLGAAPETEADARTVFSARQLLTMGRRLGWEIVHARRRTVNPAVPETADVRGGATRPLMSERVFFRSQRSIAESAGLTALLESWRGEAVFVAAFDHVALLSCLLACYEHGPRLVLVEDVLSLHTLNDEASVEAFRAAAWHLAAGSTTIAGIVEQHERRPAAFALSAPPAGRSVGANA